MLRLHTSNRLERLAECLADNIRQPLSSALEPEVIVVQSQGMARWLKLQLAQRNGICANVQFPFPRGFSYGLFQAVLSGLPDTPAYDQDMLGWQLMKCLPELVNEPQFEALQSYLQEDPDGRKLFQLCDRLAFVFDQYLVFRPEWIQQWESGGGTGWQPRLWREVSLPFREQHPAALQARFVRTLDTAKLKPEAAPERVSIFGVSALPPFYLQIFAAVAAHVDVSLYLLQPSTEFWGDIRSAREQEKTLKRAGKSAAQASELHLETGNRLLASMGQLGREFLNLLHETGDWHQTDESLFGAPGEDSVLSCIQSDILTLRDRGTEGMPRTEMSASDDSVQVHSCHSPVRELEVLYDHLLDWFQRDPELAPRDVLVMIPELELYAPYIQAVFGAPEQEPIPFSVADRATRTESHLAETFLSVLKLAGSRLGAGEVLAVLEATPVRNRFGLTESELELVRHWVAEVRIRWGRDPEQRAAFGLPQWEENTWQHGLDRLLLGYASAGEQHLFKGILPYPDVEGATAETLGKLAAFTECLFRLLDRLKTARPLDEWADLLHSVLDSLFEAAEQGVQERQVLQSAIEQFRQARRFAGFHGEVGLAVVLEKLERTLGEDHFGAGYLSGGVTFCALKPMRSIPAKIICLLGMSDRSFPRVTPQLSFDLMAEKHRPGDRSSRDDDRYLFLETLLSARERLYISYVGQSSKDNSPSPPSVLVSELLDYLEQGFEPRDNPSVRDRVVTRERLQAFSRAYFEGGRLFSYSRENLQASQALVPKRKARAEFLSQALPEPEPEWKQVSLQDLAGFFCHPARHLATRRLGLRLPSDNPALEEREAFAVDGLDRYQLQQELLEQRIRGASLEQARGLVRASGRLPAGAAGDGCFSQVRRDIEEFAQVLTPLGAGSFRPPTLFTLKVSEFVVSGAFNHVTAGHLLFYRPAKLKAKDRLRAWLEHLLWNASQLEPLDTLLVGTGQMLKLRCPPDSPALLRGLLALYGKGLRQPLKFFPATSFAFAEAEHKAGPEKPNPEKALQAARDAWQGKPFSGPGESEDEYLTLFFRGMEVLDNDFEANARAVFAPMLAASQEVKA